MFSNIVLQMVGSIIRRTLTVLAGALIAHGFWEASEAPAYVEFLSTVLTVGLLTVAYAAYDKWVKPLAVKLLAK